MQNVANKFAALAMVLMCGGCASVRPPETPPGPSVRVMTYNVNYGVLPEGALGFIEREDADVLCLQESTPQWEVYARAHLAKRYPYMRFHHEPAAGGMAVLSRQPIEELFYEIPTNGWFHGWGFKTGTPAGPVQFFNVHLHPALNERGSVSLGAYYTTRSTRREEIAHLCAKMNPGVPGVVLGDFNENDGGAAMQYLGEAGFRDSLGQFDSYAKTWHWETSVLSVKGRFDHIMCSPELHCYQARVLREGDSDHWPVVAVLGKAGE